MTTTMTTKDKEAAFVKHQVQLLRDEMWAKDGRKAEIFAYLDGISRPFIPEFAVEHTFGVSHYTAQMMVASWRSAKLEAK